MNTRRINMFTNLVRADTHLVVLKFDGYNLLSSILSETKLNLLFLLVRRTLIFNYFSIYRPYLDHLVSIEHENYNTEKQVTVIFQSEK
jgi:hypothetical protein